AGLYAAEYAAGLSGTARPAAPTAWIEEAAADALRPFGDAEAAPGAESAPPENPYALHQELQQTMNDLVGIIRRAPEMEEALTRLAALRERAGRVRVEGHRQYNPGWHLALDLRNMLLVSECVARAALERKESRGGHTRDDYPRMERSWRRVNLLCELPEPGAGVRLRSRDLPPMRPDLRDLFEKEELAKYLTDEELTEP